MKKILCATLAVLTLLAMVACNNSLAKSEFGADAVAIMPYYHGEGEDDPFYQFTEEDLSIKIIYADTTKRDLEEGFEIVTETEEGYFIIFVKWNGLEGDLMIPIGKQNYQDYRADIEATRQEMAESLEAESFDVEGTPVDTGA